MNQSCHIIEIRKTDVFAAWIARMEAGLLGDVRPVGGGVSELRVDHGPGYRVYFAQRGARLVILLCGGDKGSQKRDIAKAQALAAGLEDGA